MGKKYSQPSEGEHNQIYALVQEKVFLRRIGEITGRNVSTISREIRRNKAGRGYSPGLTHKKVCERRKAPKNIKLPLR